MAANSSLHLVKEIAQLHKDHKTSHGQPDVPKELQGSEKQEDTIIKVL